VEGARNVGDSPARPSVSIAGLVVMLHAPRASWNNKAATGTLLERRMPNVQPNYVPVTLMKGILVESASNGFDAMQKFNASLHLARSCPDYKP